MGKSFFFIGSPGGAEKQQRCGTTRRSGSSSISINKIRSLPPICLHISTVASLTEQLKLLVPHVAFIHWITIVSKPSVIYTKMAQQSVG